MAGSPRQMHRDGDDVPVRAGDRHAPGRDLPLEAKTSTKARTVIIRDRKDPRNKAGNDQSVPLLPEAWAIVSPSWKGPRAGSCSPTAPSQ